MSISIISHLDPILIGVVLYTAKVLSCEQVSLQSQNGQVRLRQSRLYLRFTGKSTGKLNSACFNLRTLSYHTKFTKKKNP